MTFSHLFLRGRAAQVLEADELALWTAQLKAETGMPLIKTIIDDAGSGKGGRYQFRHLSFQESLFVMSVVESLKTSTTLSFWASKEQAIAFLKDAKNLNSCRIGGGALGDRLLCQWSAGSQSTLLAFGDAEGKLDLNGRELGADAGAAVAALLEGLPLNASRAPQQLSSSMRNNRRTPLTYIDLGDNRLGVEGARALAQSLGKNSELTTLDVSNNQISMQGFMDKGGLCAALEQNTTLTSVNVLANFDRLAEPCVDELLRIREAKRGKLKTLCGLHESTVADLGGSAFTYADAKLVAAELTNHPALTALHVNEGAVGAAGAQLIGEALLASDHMGLEALTYIRSHPQQQQRFEVVPGQTSLDLCGTDLGSAAAFVLAGVLKFHRTLRVANVLKNNLDSAAARALAQIGTDRRIQLTSIGMLTEPSVGIFEGEGLKPPDAILIASDLHMSTELRALNLRSNPLSVEGAQAIGVALRTNSTLQRLELNKQNQMGTEGYRAIFEALCENPKDAIRSWDLSNHGDVVPALIGTLSAYTSASRSLTLLNLRGCKLAADGAAQLARAIAAHPSLTECELRDNRLGVQGWTAVFEALQAGGSSRLARWDLSGEGLDPEVAAPLSAYLGGVPSLTALSVASNAITGSYAQQLADAVLTHPSLEDFSGLPLVAMRADAQGSALDLPERGLGVPEALVLAQLLHTTCATLAELNVDSNRLAGQTNHVKASKVGGTSFSVGDAVTYLGVDMIISQGRDGGGDIKLVDMSGAKALADGIATAPALRCVSIRDNYILGNRTELKDLMKNAVARRANAAEFKLEM